MPVSPRRNLLVFAFFACFAVRFVRNQETRLDFEKALQGAHANKMDGHLWSCSCAKTGGQGDKLGAASDISEEEGDGSGGSPIGRSDTGTARFIMKCLVFQNSKIECR